MNQRDQGGCLKSKEQMEQGCQMIFFVPKITILEYFRGPWKGKCWYIL
jgi:hypothetical protein